MPTYRIVRHYRDLDTPSETIREGLSRAEAQAHCSDPSTSTDEYFDGFDEEDEAYREYQGYTNHATWAVDLWINNDYASYKMLQMSLPIEDDSEARFFVENIIPGEVLSGILSDISPVSLDVVNWSELREAWNGG